MNKFAKQNFNFISLINTTRLGSFILPKKKKKKQHKSKIVLLIIIIIIVIIIIPEKESPTFTALHRLSQFTKETLI